MTSKLIGNSQDKMNLYAENLDAKSENELLLLRLNFLQSLCNERQSFQ